MAINPRAEDPAAVTAGMQEFWAKLVEPSGAV